MSRLTDLIGSISFIVLGVLFMTGGAIGNGSIGEMSKVPCYDKHNNQIIGVQCEGYTNDQDLIAGLCALGFFMGFMMSLMGVAFFFSVVINLLTGRKK